MSNSSLNNSGLNHIAQRVKLFSLF